MSTAKSTERQAGMHFTVAAMRQHLPSAAGERFYVAAERGQLAVELYEPIGHDPQEPHTRDECYVVVEGQGDFVMGDERIQFGPGDFLFVPAGMPHRFEHFGERLTAWVIFYGPEGGE